MEIIPFVPTGDEKEEDRKNKRSYTTKYDFGRTNYVSKDELHANRPGRYDDAPRAHYHETRAYLLDKQKSNYSSRNYQAA